MSTITVPMATKLGRVLTYLEALLPKKLYCSWMTWSSKITWQIISPLPWFLGHQTWQVGDLPWETPIYEVTWIFDHMVLLNHVTNWGHYIFATTLPMAMKLDRDVTYLEVLLPKKLMALESPGPARSCDKLKTPPQSL